MKRLKKMVLAAVLMLVIAGMAGCGNKDITGNDTGENEKYKEESPK